MDISKGASFDVCSIFVTILSYTILVLPCNHPFYSLGIYSETAQYVSPVVKSLFATKPNYQPLTEQIITNHTIFFSDVWYCMILYDTIWYYMNLYDTLPYLLFRLKNKNKIKTASTAQQLRLFCGPNAELGRLSESKPSRTLRSLKRAQNGGMVEEPLLHVDKYVCIWYMYTYIIIRMYMSYVCRYDIICMCTSSTWLDIMSYAELHMIDMELSWEMSYHDAPSLAHTSHIAFGVLQIHLEMCRWVTPTKTLFLRFRTCERIAEKSWCNELSEVKMKSVLKINGHSLLVWWVSTHLKNMIVQLEIFPNFQGKNEKMFELPPPTSSFWYDSNYFNHLFFQAPGPHSQKSTRYVALPGEARSPMIHFFQFGK